MAVRVAAPYPGPFFPGVDGPERHLRPRVHQSTRSRGLRAGRLGSSARVSWVTRKSAASVRIFWIGVVVVALTVAGCSASHSTAEQPSQPPSTVDQGITADYLGPITRNDTEANTGVSLLVPPDHDKPAIPWQEAVGLCIPNGLGCNQGGSMVRVSLAFADAPGAAPLLDQKLAYVFAWPTGPCSPGGLTYPNNMTTTSHPASCLSLSFIDAKSGQALGSISTLSLTDPSAY